MTQLAKPFLLVGEMTAGKMKHFEAFGEISAMPFTVRGAAQLDSTILQKSSEQTFITHTLSLSFSI